MKFTKGPWIVVEAISHGISFLAVAGHDGTEIAMTGINQEKIDAEQKANAKLIASAPELYEACKDILHQLETESCVGDIAVSNLVHAIRKAEGK